MDSSPDWTASALFSPSKARAQQARAKDWAFVDGWLAKKYGSRLPSFERNEETLQALLALATVNETADEQYTLINKVEKAMLQASTKRRRGEDDIYGRLAEAMGDSGRESLDVLAESALQLGSLDVTKAAEGFCMLTAEHFKAFEQLKRATIQQAALKKEHARLAELLRELNGNVFTAPPDLLEQTIDWARNTKHLKAKVVEYDERLSTLRLAPSTELSIEDVARQVTDLMAQKVRLEALQGELSALGGLPPDPLAARAEIEKARMSLRGQTTKRDELFEGLVASR